MQSLKRVLALLEAVADSGQSVAVGDVSSRADLPLSTTSRLLAELAEEGLVEKDSHGHYVLGPRLFELTHRAPGRLTLASAARPEMSALRDELGETVSLHVRYGDQRVCVAAATSDHPVSRVVPEGLAMPLFGTATGTVLLANAPEHRREEILGGRDLEHSALDQLRNELSEVRDRGWSFVADEWVEGVTGISVAVPYGEGRTAALSVSGPSFRFTEERAREVLPTVQRFADRISEKLRLVDNS